MATRKTPKAQPPRPTGAAQPRDQLDRDLLALLQADARMSVANLARKLEVARTTVLARLARLETDGVIVGYTVRLGADAADQGLQAYVGVSINAKQQRDVLKRLARMPELIQLVSVSGEFDYIALLRATTATRLDALLDEIGEIDGVIRTTTSVVLALKIDRRPAGGATLLP
ncbi:MAG TPA: Lrp/AsnC family transcriptional regulator [Ramlibacter sp.]|nr:Lrp/AsnC family transcriptional regulator [Ramlibacter sp.]